MKDTYYTLRIGHVRADRNWLVDKYKSLREAEAEAELFSSCGFWISIRKHGYESFSSETLLNSTWNDNDTKFKA